MKPGEVPPLPGLVGVRALRQCALCGRLREGEAWRVERGARVELRRSRLLGAVPVCGACLVVRVVRLLARGARLVEGAGGSWLVVAARDGARVEVVGPLALRRAVALGASGGALGGLVEGQSGPAAEGTASGPDRALLRWGGEDASAAAPPKVVELVERVKGGS